MKCKEYRNQISTSTWRGTLAIQCLNTHTLTKKLRKVRLLFCLCAKKKRVKFAKYIKALVVWLLRGPRSAFFFLYSTVAHRLDGIIRIRTNAPKTSGTLKYFILTTACELNKFNNLLTVQSLYKKYFEDRQTKAIPKCEESSVKNGKKPMGTF